MHPLVIRALDEQRFTACHRLDLSGDSAAGQPNTREQREARKTKRGKGTRVANGLAVREMDKSAIGEAGSLSTRTIGETVESPYASPRPL